MDYEYYPRDAFFVRITKGCIRSCKFCAVPLLEKKCGTMSPLHTRISQARQHGEKQHLLIMDNNILGIAGIKKIIGEIRSLGFEATAKRKSHQRTGDFN